MIVMVVFLSAAHLDIARAATLGAGQLLSTGLWSTQNHSCFGVRSGTYHKLGEKSYT
jgi:hypothetical protein